VFKDAAANLRMRWDCTVNSCTGSLNISMMMLLLVMMVMIDDD